MKLALLIVFFSTLPCSCAFTGQPKSELFFMLPSIGSPDAEEKESARGTFGDIGNYLANRALDFADIFKINIGVGLGLNANVRATQIFQIGGFYTGATKIGMTGRHIGAWNENSFEFGVPLLFYGRDVDITAAEKGGHSFRSFRQQILWKFEGMSKEENYDNNYDRQFLEVGVSVHAVIPAFEFAIRLKELVDFLVGFTTIDLCGDDSK